MRADRRVGVVLLGLFGWSACQSSSRGTAVIVADDGGRDAAAPDLPVADGVDDNNRSPLEPTVSDGRLDIAGSFADAMDGRPDSTGGFADATNDLGGSDSASPPDATAEVAVPLGVAPDDLRVGDRPHPLNVEGAPLFSWHPHDAAGDQTQTAYQVQVRLQRADTMIWDSGKVLSSEQSYVAYAGPALAAGESYTWIVRTWNRGGLASGWSASAAFDTGLPNNGAAWGATWIRRASTGADAVDDYTWARVERNLGASPIRRARAYVSANHQFELHINGVVADRGPAFSYPGEGYYQATDLTSLVRAGSPVAVGVLYHWYGSGQGRPAGEPGLLVRIAIDHDDGSRELIVTDGTWRVRRAAPWQTGAPLRSSDSGDYVEWIDMRQAADGWDLPGFAATGWTAPQVVGPHPSGVFTSLRGQEPRLRATVVSPTVRTLADGTVVADFGNVIPARPVVRFASGVAGRTLNLLAGYRLTSDGHVSAVTTTTQGSDLSFRFIQRAGAQEFRPFTYFGWRYLQISAPGESLSSAAISAIVERTDAADDGAAQFESSDTTLNTVFALVQRSAIESVQQQFFDTPTREKGPFLADTVNESFATMMAWSERDATQKSILEFVASQARFWPDGRINAVYPNGDGQRDIPDFTELFPIWVWRYFLETGDRTVLGRAYPTMQRIADYVWGYRDGGTGLVTNLAGGSGDYLNGIVDWPLTERRGYDMATTARTTMNILAVDLMRSTASAAAALARPAAEATTYRTRADQLTSAINARLRRADGVYIDGSTGAVQSTHASQHASSYALAFGIVPAGNLKAVADYVAGMGMSQGPMTAHWLAKALGDNERFDALLALFTDRVNPGWANILAQGATFTWESWDAPVRGESESHGWGSQVAVDILEQLLGMKVTTPGAATVGIRPPRTGLTFARGVVHTQRGPVGVDWSRTTPGLTLKVDIPMNVRAEISLPAVDVAATTAMGAGAPTYRATAGGWVIYDVGSGQSTFTAR
jgi:alpha-L-rhamnosidase